MRRVLAAASLMALFAGAASSFAACSTLETNEAPDASPRSCNRGPFVFCQPVRPDESGCSTDEGPGQYMSRLPRATRYPLGCVVNYVGARDEQGDCPLEAVCKCVSSSTIAPPSNFEAGVAEAAAPVPLPPNVPVWACTP